jgi:hypothetical protein
MKSLLALISGAGAALIAILLHQSIPPFGVSASLLFTYIAIWSVGRRFGNRRYKWWATLGWVIVIFRGATFGAGQELLVQGDGVGSTLLLLGTLTSLAAVAARN